MCLWPTASGHMAIWSCLRAPGTTSVWGVDKKQGLKCTEPKQVYGKLFQMYYVIFFSNVVMFLVFVSFFNICNLLCFLFSLQIIIPLCTQCCIIKWVWLFLKRAPKLHEDWNPWDLDCPLPLNIKPEKLAFILEAIRNRPRIVANLYTGAGLHWLERAVKFPGILHSGRRHIGSLKSTTVGVFIPQKLTTATNQAFLHPHSQRASCKV